MAPHPTPQIHPIPTEEVQERLKRRLQTPKAMAPAPRQRQIQVLSWAASLGNSLNALKKNYTIFIQVFSIGLSAYVVLFADFGTEKNCYTPVSSKNVMQMSVLNALIHLDS